MGRKSSAEREFGEWILGVESEELIAALPEDVDTTNMSSEEILELMFAEIDQNYADDPQNSDATGSEVV